MISEDIKLHTFHAFVSLHSKPSGERVHAEYYASKRISLIALCVLSETSTAFQLRTRQIFISLNFMKLRLTYVVG